MKLGLRGRFRKINGVVYFSGIDRMKGTRWKNVPVEQIKQIRQKQETKEFKELLGLPY